MAQTLLMVTLFVTAMLAIQSNAQFEFLPEFSRNNLLQFIRNLQDVTGARIIDGNDRPAEVQVIVHSPSGFDQQFFRRQDDQVQFQQPRFQLQPQFQQPNQPQFQQPPQPQFQPPPLPLFQPQPQPQPQPTSQPQFQLQPFSSTQPPRPTPQPITESTTPLNITENFIQPEAEFRQRPQKEPQFLTPGSGRWLLQQDPACLPCICETASGCDETLQCDSRGFCGPFLLSKRYWTLAGKPLLRGDNPDRPAASADCLRDPICAAEAVRGYLDRFAQDCDGNRRVDCLDLARIHFQGPFNCRARPFEYMDSFRRCWDRSARSRNFTT